jgi:hypothetical protein
MSNNTNFLLESLKIQMNAALELSKLLNAQFYEQNKEKIENNKRNKVAEKK